MRGALSPSPRGRLAAHRGRGAAILAALAVVLALVGAACGDDGPEAPPAGQAGSPAAFVPAGAPVYLDVTTDDAGEQWTQAAALAQRFPAFADLLAEIEAELGADGVTFDELRAVSGARAGLALLRLDGLAGEGVPTSVDLEDEGILLVAELEERQEEAALELFRAGEPELRPAGEHGGVEYHTAPDTALAVVDQTLVVATTEADLFAALDAHDAGGAETLAGVERFQQTLEGLPPETAATGYLALGALLAELTADTPELEGLGLESIGENATLGLAATAEAGGVRVTGVTPAIPGAAQGTAFEPTLLDRLPDDAIAYIALADPAGAVGEGFAQAQGDAAEGLKQQVEFFSGQLQAALGVTTADLAALFGGEAGVAVLPGPELPGAVLMLKVEDPERATRTLTRLREGVPQILGATGAQAAGRFRQVPLENGVRGWELPILPGVSVVYGVEDDVVYLATSTEAIIQVQSPEAKLVDSAEFTTATADMPEELGGLVFLSVPRAIEALESAGVLGEVPPDVAANLEPLGGIAAWNLPGEPPRFEAFVAVEE